jgi:hypothetical protein
VRLGAQDEHEQERGEEHRDGVRDPAQAQADEIRDRRGRERHPHQHFPEARRAGPLEPERDGHGGGAEDDRRTGPHEGKREQRQRDDRQRPAANVVDAPQALVEPCQVVARAADGPDVGLRAVRQRLGRLRDVRDRDEAVEARRVGRQDAGVAGRVDGDEIAVGVGMPPGRWQLDVHRRAGGTSAHEHDLDLAAGPAAEERVLDLAPLERRGRSGSADRPAGAGDVEAEGPWRRLPERHHVDGRRPGRGWRGGGERHHSDHCAGYDSAVNLASKESDSR